MTVDLPVPPRVLAIGAHPDDVELTSGATLAKWAAAGAEVSILVCTDGSKGTWDPHADTAALVATRQAEQRESARRLGATGQVVFLGEVDGELVQERRLVDSLARWIRVLRPTVLLTHDPWRRWRLHPDHRNAGFLVCDAVVAARDPHFFPEHGIPHHRPDLLLLFESEDPDHAEDASGWGEAKLAALLAFESQFESTMFVPTDDDGSAMAAFRARTLDGLAEAGRPFGLAAAETFRRIDEV